MTAATPSLREPSFVKNLRLTRDEQRMLCAARSIKDRYNDGEPLRGKDGRLLVALLKRHPKATSKIGPGVAAIVVDRFVVRTDGTVEDFSIYRCLGSRDRRTAKVLAMMRRFNYQAVLRHRRRQRATPR